MILVVLSVAIPCPTRPEYAVHPLMWYMTLPVDAMDRSPFPPIVAVKWVPRTDASASANHGNCVYAPMLPILGWQWWGLANVNEWIILFTSLFNGSSVGCSLVGVKPWYEFFTHCSLSHVSIHKSLPYSVLPLILYLWKLFISYVYYYRIYRISIWILIYIFLPPVISSIKSKWLRLPLTTLPTEKDFLL